MEENNTQKKIDFEKEDKLSEDGKKEAQELNNQTIYDQYKKENPKVDTGKKEEKEDGKEKENNPQSNDIKKDITNENENTSNNNINTKSVEKSKRHRRGKNEINERNYRCPDCDKCYLSGPALTTHRKTKHGYGNNGEKRNRGRPKKDGQSENSQNNPLNKYNNFFNDVKRKPNTFDQTSNSQSVSTEIIKDFLVKIFNQCKNDLFKDIENIEKYSFYELFIQNWEKENPFPNQESFSATTKNGEPSIKSPSYNLDELFFLYLKEFSTKTNKEYFWFMIKFVVLFRECINNLRNLLVKQEDKTEKKQLYTQIYNAETVPEICNDFFVEFMEPYNFFGLYKEELIELIQHFCYWLFSKKYAQSHLTLLDS